MTTAQKTRKVAFEKDAWTNNMLEMEAERVRIPVLVEHVREAQWSRFRDPISRAIGQYLGDDTCVDLFWNSDSWAPRYDDDDARIGIHKEAYCPQSGCFLYEVSCYVPLPQKATRAMWRLRSTGQFEPLTMEIDIPKEMLRKPGDEPKPSPY